MIAMQFLIVNTEPHLNKYETLKFNVFTIKLHNFNYVIYLPDLDTQTRLHFDKPLWICNIKVDKLLQMKLLS